MGKPATSRTCHLCFQQLQRDNLNNLTSTVFSDQTTPARARASVFGATPKNSLFQFFDVRSEELGCRLSLGDVVHSIPPLHSGNFLSASSAYFLVAYGAPPTIPFGFSPKSPVSIEHLPLSPSLTT